ncbi:MAG: tRNA (adenosine(37)-N6)-threonylcarbamoyltransferase complex transferase subunit TsaD [Bacteroidota bacterium]|jgi:N6-L-threonylcarbamoyladenine synthase
MLAKSIYTLAIESSCDETSAAVLCNNKVLANFIATQKIHETFGGVVPELASRAHQQNIVPVVEKAISSSGISLDNINAIAFTNGPGLMGALLVGSSFAKGLAMSLNVPLIEVNHMEAHIQSHFIAENVDGSKNEIPEFPFLCLTVSGGHTQIVLVKDFLTFKLIGQTQDDAAGEAFDKVAKIIGLPYPGGPYVDKFAQLGNEKMYSFPIAKMQNSDFSFSGFKTSFLYLFEKLKRENVKIEGDVLNDLCASAQYTICKTLVDKIALISKELNIKNIAIAGGVSANSGLRNMLQTTAQKYNWKLFIPRFEYCTDNAAMIGISAYYKFLGRQFSDGNIAPNPRMTIGV